MAWGVQGAGGGLDPATLRGGAGRATQPQVARVRVTSGGLLQIQQGRGLCSVPLPREPHIQASCCFAAPSPQ